ncbi:PAS domain S-box-containing protein [Bosea sp. BE271]|uniref:EAL domain-containing protein n=1 Tax=Bosea TaxID=85413 RepID=UPI002863C76F|nr:MULTISPECIES: EAL domain-containing protein [Bosea]MDR6829015.1 PAS domain S-box-containing protein [Bosea robiniae]MDR6895899.1 PAS domain S-box-containing protein [Bosea sp. BE109]MDR7139296.1 PAS domain S-box-containing protein [Bosea sp. BE168]MDR7175995.1 PAS domain S-box-containing protein [Bosea sp. BE271]
MELLLLSRSYLFALLAVALVVLAGAHDRLREAVLDGRFHVVKRAPSGTIAMVEIDPRSIAAIGRWPWPRSLHADLIGKLAELGVTDIAFDVDFSARSVDPEDRRFAEALRGAGGSVILPIFRQIASDADGARQGYVNRPLAMFETDAWLGMVNVTPDRDGFARDFSFGATIDGQFIPSIASLLAGLHEPSAPEFRIDFGIDGGAVRGLSYIDILHGTGDLTALRGKKVIVAGTAAELGDRFVIPGGQIIPGALLQVLAAESMLQGRALRTTTLTLSIALLLLPLFVAFVLRRRRARHRILAVISAAIAAEAGAIAIQFIYPIAIDTSLLHVAAAAYALIGLVEEVDLRGLLRLAAEKRFDNVAMSLSDGLVCVDRDGRISMSNAAASRIFGFDSAQMRSLQFGQLLAGDPAGRDAGAPPTADGQVREEMGKRANGELFPLECSWSVWETPSGRQYGVVLRDISERRRQQERIRYLAETDPVSDLPNGNSLIAALSDALRRDEPQRLMLASLWHFRRMRDLEGQTFADALIRAAATRLKSRIGQGVILSRSDSDEFAILLPASQVDVDRLAASLIETFRNEPLEAEGRAVRVPIVLGYAGSEEAADPEVWLGNARFALAAAQRQEAEIAVSFAPGMRDEVEKRMALENRLRQALTAGEFELFYQPQVDLQTRLIVGAEALIRWHHPERGFVSPGEFMPVINGSSLADGVSAWVLETAIRQAAIWQQRGTPLRVGINLSQSQFTAGTIAVDVARLLETTRLDPAWLELEVTEDIILDDISRVRAILGSLRELGVHIAFDDFGTGYGSLTSLRDFPLDSIKVDQTFVRNLEPGSENAAIVAATIDLGKALGKSIIAEGIETEAVAVLLTALGCQEGQGYLFGRPMPAHQIEKTWLRWAA